MPYGVLLYRRSTNRLGCACSSREARALHAPRQEVTGGRDGPTKGGSRQSSSEFGLQPERHSNRNLRFRPPENSWRLYEPDFDFLDEFFGRFLTPNSLLSEP